MWRLYYSICHWEQRVKFGLTPSLWSLRRTARDGKYSAPVTQETRLVDYKESRSQLAGYYICDFGNEDSN